MGIVNVPVVAVLATALPDSEPIIPLLSTETFSPTHWGPLALAWGLSHPSEEAS